MTSEVEYIRSPRRRPVGSQILDSLRLRGVAKTSRLMGWKAVSAVAGARSSAWKEALWRRESVRYDRQYNVRTAGWIALRDLDVQAGSGSDYVVFRPLWAARELLARIDIRHEDFSFIDFGSGMGRILFLAAEYSYRQIIGVEFAPELHDIALRNLATFRNPQQRCTHISAVSASAERFSLPSGNLVLCFFNPFGPDIMRPVLENARNAFLQGQKIYIAYGKPKCGFLMDAAPWLRKTAESLFADCWYSVYESVGS